MTTTQRLGIKLCRDGVAFRWWHHFSEDTGTGIHWAKWSKGLFGVMFSDGAIHVGCWWHIRLDLIQVHPNAFKGQP